MTSGDTTTFGAADPAAMAEAAVSLFWPEARARGLDLAVFIDPDCPRLIRTDPARLRHLLGRLVTNALAFTAVGGVLIEVTPIRGGLRLTARDSGGGHAPAALAECRRLIDGLGGRLSVSAQPGVGTLVSADIPAAVVEPAAGWPRLSGKAAVALTAPCARAALTAYLERAGLTIGSAAATVFSDADFTLPLRRADVLARLAAPLAPVAAAPPVHANAADLFDPQVSAELAAMTAQGKDDFVQRVRGLYRENAPPAARRVIEASASGSTHEAALAAHALKSMSLNIGARAVAELAGRIEARARDPGVVDPSLAEALYRRLLETLDALDAPTPAAVAAMTAEDEALADDLAGAADRGEFSLAYQPQVDRDGVTLVGLECLLRWNHPVRGAVSPALFIPVAERRGLIRAITRWVLDQALRETVAFDDVSIGVNASALEFSDPSFVDELAVQLARHRFPASRLEIEITETAVLGDGEEVRHNIRRMQALGVKIALDDFGVGYSSLSHLRMFGFDKLKIDRAFVTDCATDMQSATLVHAVVSVGRAMGMKVVAEGIETEAQWDFLKVAGVHALQGYLFGRPEPISALNDRLRIISAAHRALKVA